MRRRHVHQAGVGRQRGDDEALGVDRHADHPGAACGGTARRAGGYPGSSTATRSPGPTSTRPIRSRACWAPLVTSTSSARARTARDDADVPGDRLAQRRRARPGRGSRPAAASRPAARRRRAVARSRAGTGPASGMPTRKSYAGSGAPVRMVRDRRPTAGGGARRRRPVQRGAGGPGDRGRGDVRAGADAGRRGSPRRSAARTRRRPCCGPRRAAWPARGSAAGARRAAAGRRGSRRGAAGRCWRRGRRCR